MLLSKALIQTEKWSASDAHISLKLYWEKAGLSSAKLENPDQFN